MKLRQLQSTAEARNAFVVEFASKPTRTGALALLGALALGGAFAASPPADRLGQYPVDPGQISVAGFSSGAFMANQLHIAHSADIMGAAMIAGGLYGCAVAGRRARTACSRSRRRRSDPA